MSLLDDLRADTGQPVRCKFCIWLATRPAAERAEWAMALTDKSFSSSVLHRGATKRGFTGQEASLRKHRMSGHSADSDGRR